MIYEVVLSQRYFNQQCVNRFNYLSTGTPVGVNGAFALFEALGGEDTAGAFPALSVFETIRDIQSNQVVWQTVLIKAIREAPLDFWDVAFAAGVVGGNSAGEASSPFEAFGFRSTRTRTDIRRGQKRFVGVTEGSLDPGGILTDDAYAAAELTAAAMGETLSYTEGGNSLTFAPIIVHKEKYVDAGKTKYRYYETVAEQMDHIMQGISWSPFESVRSQTSRQYGKGQ